MRSPGQVTLERSTVEVEASLYAIFFTSDLEGLSTGSATIRAVLQVVHFFFGAFSLAEPSPLSTSEADRFRFRVSQ